MAGKVPRMRTPAARQIIGTGHIRLEPSQDVSTRAVLEQIQATLTGTVTSIAGSGPRIITYVANGTEGTDFRVPIGVTLAHAVYEVGLFGIAGADNVPMCDFPTGPGDRTPANFRVLTAAPPTDGDVIKFELVEV